MKVDPGGLCQIEIPVTDIDQALDFYQKVLGWEEAPCDIHNYKVIQVPPGNPFGISLIKNVGHYQGAKGTILYFKAQDPDQVAAKAEEFLGNAMPPGRNMPGYGWVRVIEDPAGNRIGLYAPS